MDPHVYYSWLFLLLIVTYASSTSYITASPAHTRVVHLQSPRTLPELLSTTERIGVSDTLPSHFLCYSALWSFHTSLNSVRSIHLRKKKGLSFQFIT